MSDTKHTPETDGDASAVFDCLKYHASAGGEYEYRGTLAIEAFTRICNEILSLRAAAEKARELIRRYRPQFNRDTSWPEALAALEEVLK